MRITIGICTCNRDRLLRELLERLMAIELGQLAAEDASLLIVDNRPNDATRRLCEEMAPLLPIRLRYVAEAVPGISLARNRAVAEALADGADVLAFIDDDDLPEPDWLVHLVERQVATGADIVMGNWVAGRSKVDDEAEGLLTNEARIWKSNGLPHRLSTCNVLIGRPILELMASRGPVFDPAFAFMGGGDADFFFRASLAGAEIVREERSLVNFRQAPERGTVRGVMRRKFKGGLSQGVLVRRYLDNGKRAVWLGKNLARLGLGLVALPLAVLSRKQATHRTSKVAWALGAFYGFAGGRFDYYAHS